MGKSPANALTRVDLPAPFAPMTPSGSFALDLPGGVFETKRSLKRDRDTSSVRNGLGYLHSGPYSILFFQFILSRQSG